MFGVTPNVEISADDYAYISADAFRLMLQNSNREPASFPRIPPSIL